MTAKWICLANEVHVFDYYSGDGWCPTCAPWTGILVHESALSKSPNTKTTANITLIKHSKNKKRKAEGKWVCSNNHQHVFDSPTNEGWCPICPQHTGILIQQ